MKDIVDWLPEVEEGAEVQHPFPNHAPRILIGTTELLAVAKIKTEFSSAPIKLICVD